MTTTIQNGASERAAGSYLSSIDEHNYYLNGAYHRDAVYPACPEEIASYMKKKDRLRDGDVFYRDASTFDLLLAKP